MCWWSFLAGLVVVPAIIFIIAFIAITQEEYDPPRDY